MSIRFGPGPVFVYETIAATRRRQTYLLRAGFVFVLLIGLALVGLSLGLGMGFENGPGATLRVLSELGENFYYTISTIQITLILVAAPAATAGAVCLDRARGSLTHMLVTDLSDTEIVVGKLTANLLKVFGLVAAAVPVLALATLLGGIIPEALILLTVVSLTLAMFGCAFALAVSARVGKTHEVLMFVMMTWIIWIIGPLFWMIFLSTNPPDWLLKFNPYSLAWGPYSSPNWIKLEDVLIFVAVMLVGSLFCVVYAIKRLRYEPKKAKVAGRSRLASLSAITRWIPRQKEPTLDANPVLWREWHKSRPSKLTRFVWGIYWFGAIALTGWVIYALIDHGGGNGGNLEIGLISGLQITVGLLLVSLSAPMALSEERTRGSLDVLMSTPLSTTSIVWGKWWGAFRVVPALAVLPVLLAAVMAVVIPEDYGAFAGPGVRRISSGLVSRLLSVVFPALFVLAQGACCTSLGLALATWFKGPGRATAVCVSIYTVLAFGWVVALEAFSSLIDFLCSWITESPGYDSFFEQLMILGLAGLCPFGGQIAPGFIYNANMFSNGTQFQPEAWVIQVMWWLTLSLSLLVLVAIAATFYALTLLSFERCLGRVSEHPRKIRTRETSIRPLRIWFRPPVGRLYPRTQT